MKNCDLIVIGGGPAGMMAAIAAGQNGTKVILLEKTASLGNKLLLTGKGRCNLTNDRPVAELVEKFGRGGKFLFSALTRFSPNDLRGFLAKRGVETKVEQGQRVFPVSDQARAVLNCLIHELKKLRIKVLVNSPALSIKRSATGFTVKTPKGNLQTLKVVLATGGRSYPQTGSTGDGYLFAKKAGHHILPLMPGINSLFVTDPRIRQLAGLTLKNVRLTLTRSQKKIASAQGELLITHQGLSGPVAYQLTVPVYQNTRKAPVNGVLDFKPALKADLLKRSLYKKIHTQSRQEVQTLFRAILPLSIINTALTETRLEPHQKNGALTPAEVSRIIDFLKGFIFRIEKTAPLGVAIVTAGGVDYREISPQTMSSRIIPGLYFAGEMIGLWGPTGGYNLQKAFSTGWIAGYSAAMNE